MARPAHSPVSRQRLALIMVLLLSLAAGLAALNLRGRGLALRCPAFLQPMRSTLQPGAAAAVAVTPGGGGGALPVQHWLDVAAAGMARRGAKVSDECDDKYGERFMRMWQRGVEPGGRPFCSADGGNGTTIRCHERPSMDADTWPLCYASGPMLLAKGGGSSWLPQVKLGCSRAAGNATAQLEGRFHPPAKQLLGSEAEYDADSEAVAARCAAVATAVSHPVFFMTRHDFTNAYHGSEDLIMAFISLAILQREDPDTGWENAELVLVEEAAAPGPFLEIWAALFPAHPDPFPEGACLQRAAFGMQGGRSLLSYIWVGNPTDCQSVVSQAYTLWLRHAFGRPAPAAAAAANAAQLPVTAGGFVMDNGEVEEASILYISRYVFEHIRKGLLTGWQSGRVIDNDPQVARALELAVEDWNAQSCILAEADLPKLNFTSGPGRRLAWLPRQSRQSRQRPQRQQQLLLQHTTRRRLAATAAAEFQTQRPLQQQQRWQQRRQRQRRPVMQLQPWQRHVHSATESWWPLWPRQRRTRKPSAELASQAAAADAGPQEQREQQRTDAKMLSAAAAQPGAAAAAAAVPELQGRRRRRRRLTQEAEQAVADGVEEAAAAGQTSAEDVAAAIIAAGADADAAVSDAAVEAAAAKHQQRRAELAEDGDGGRVADAAEWKPEGGDAAKPCRPSRLLFRLRTMELSLQPLRAQLEAVMGAKVLIGGHGAALANIIAAQPGSAALLEMFVQGYTGNYHYQVMATLNGDLYRSVVGLPPGQLDPAPVVAELISLMDEIAATRYKESTGQELGFVTNTTAAGGAP